MIPNLHPFLSSHCHPTAAGLTSRNCGEETHHYLFSQQLTPKTQNHLLTPLFSYLFMLMFTLWFQKGVTTDTKMTWLEILVIELKVWVQYKAHEYLALCIKNQNYIFKSSALFWNKRVSLLYQYKLTFCFSQVPGKQRVSCMKDLIFLMVNCVLELFCYKLQYQRI